VSKGATVGLHPPPGPGLVRANAALERLRAELIPPPERTDPGVPLIVPNRARRHRVGLEGPGNEPTYRFYEPHPKPEYTTRKSA